MQTLQVSYICRYKIKYNTWSDLSDLKKFNNKLFSANSHLKKEYKKLHRVREQQWAKFQDSYEKTWIWKFKSDISDLYRECRESRWYSLNKNFRTILQSCRSVFRKQD